MAYRGQLEADKDYDTNALSGYGALLQNFAIFYPWKLS